MSRHAGSAFQSVLDQPAKHRPILLARINYMLTKQKEWLEISPYNRGLITAQIMQLSDRSLVGMFRGLWRESMRRNSPERLAALRRYLNEHY